MFKLGRLKRATRWTGRRCSWGSWGWPRRRRGRPTASAAASSSASRSRALANEPAVLLADEPTGNLDRRNSELVAEIFRELSDNGQAIVMVTHDNALAHRARRIITMEDGAVIDDRLLATPSDAPLA